MRNFFLNDTPTTEIYTLSLHDALPISLDRHEPGQKVKITVQRGEQRIDLPVDLVLRSEEHTLNSSHSQISYAVFCLKKKKQKHCTNGRDTADPYHPPPSGLDDLVSSRM